MFFRLIKKDIGKNKLITIIITLFVSVATMLVALSAILLVDLPKAIDLLMTDAKTPHFMQMHSGSIDLEYFEDFARGSTLVDEYQVLEFLNIEGKDLIIGGHSFVGNLQDNGLSIQSGKFDFLLDLDNQVIQARKGEIYAPLCYLQDGSAKIGDEVRIGDKTLTIAGFLRDSQMNSKLSSSKRFLVNESDYAEVRSLGSVEYLIQFRLNDLSNLRAFQAEYDDARLPANGPTITYPLFKMINAISEGIVVGVLLLVSILIVMISLMCVRFTLLAKIEDDYREIGVMKAIGLNLSDIKKIFMAKYTLMFLVGGILGYVASLLLKDSLQENIRLYLGSSGKGSASIVLGAISALILLVVLSLYINSVLNNFKRISAVEAIRFGMAIEKRKLSKAMKLSNSRIPSTNVFIGIKDVIVRKKLYITTLVVLILSSFIIAIPQNLHSTISSREFVRYLGIGDSDLIFNVQQVDDIEGKTLELSRKLKGDLDIDSSVMLVTKTFLVRTKEESPQRMKIELGDHTVFPVLYFEGNAPIKENQIALSYLNAKELGVGIGDKIFVTINAIESEIIVSGIYSDITDGGKTAKASFSSNSDDVAWATLYAKVENELTLSSKISEYKELYSYAKVSGIADYNAQTFGSTTKMIENASFATFGLSFLIASLLILLFMKVIIAKDRYVIAVLKSIGFNDYDLRVQYVTRTILVALLGIIIGTILANSIGESLSGLFLSTMGVAKFKFSIDPLMAYIICPFIMLITVFGATLIGTRRIKEISISENIKE